MEGRAGGWEEIWVSQLGSSRILSLSPFSPRNGTMCTKGVMWNFLCIHLLPLKWLL